MLALHSRKQKKNSVNLDSEQIMAGTQQYNLEREMESPERRLWLTFSETFFKVAYVSPVNFKESKENTQSQALP